MNAVPQIPHERMSYFISVAHFPFCHLKFLGMMLGRTSRHDETLRWFPLQSCFPRLVLAGIVVCLATLVLWGNGSLLHAQESEDLKKGVVKITATAAGQQRVGTGFIVRIEDKTAYILTASHVVEGSALTVNFFPDPDKDYAGTTRNMQGGNPKGLAVIKVEDTLPNGIRSLVLASNFAVQGGERATVIGFRRSPSIQWGVLQGILTGQTGADLIVSGVGANEGNSGGPILHNEKVVGVMTEVLDDIGYAVPASITQIILKGWGVHIKPANSFSDPVVPSETNESDPKKIDSAQKSTGQDEAPREFASANDSPSIDIDNPTWLSANEIRGEGVGEDVSYYYTFLAEPGTLKITADGKNRWGGMSNVIGVVLMDMDANELFKVSVANTMIDKRVVKRVKIHKPQQILMRVLLSEFTLDYQLRIEGAVNLEAAQPPRTDQSNHQAMIATNDSSSINIDEPRWLSANEIRGEGVGEDVSYYYTFLAEPGTLKITADGKNRWGGMSNVIGVVLMDMDANELFKVSVANTMIDKRVVKRVKIHKPQQILMRVLLSEFTLDYQLRIEGAVNLEAAQPLKAKTGKDEAPLVQVSEGSLTISSSAVILPGEAQNKLPQGGENVDHAVALAPGTYVLTHEIRRKQVEVFQLSLKPGETLVVTWRTPPIDNAKADVAIHDIVGAIQIQDRLFHKKSQVKSIQYQARDGGIHYVSIGSKYGNHAGTVYKISIVP